MVLCDEINGKDTVGGAGGEDDLPALLMISELESIIFYIFKHTLYAEKHSTEMF